MLTDRDPRQRMPAFMGFIAGLPCIACMARGRGLKWGVQVAHIRASYRDDEGELLLGWREVGKAEKPHDWRTAPLCVDCHLNGPDAQHRSNETEWWAELGIYPPDLCLALMAAFKAGRDGAVVIARFAAQARKD